MTYFSERGAFRWDDVMATDFALNYALPIGPAQLFIQPEVINLFDDDAQVSGDNTILTRNNGCVQGANGPNPGDDCLAFNPYTETPVEGIHFQYGDEFGQAQTPTTQLTQGDFQLPRTYRFSLGIKF